MASRTILGRQPHRTHPETWARHTPTGCRLRSPFRSELQRLVASDLEISILGPCQIPSPLADRLSQAAVHYVGQDERVLLDDRLSRLTEFKDDLTRAPAFELAGRATGCSSIPASLKCGIVTCGGLCPGLNNVVRGLVLELNHGYGVRQIVGFRYGYEGLPALWPSTAEPDAGVSGRNSSRGRHGARHVPR